MHLIFMMHWNIDCRQVLRYVLLLTLQLILVSLFIISFDYLKSKAAPILVLPQMAAEKPRSCGKVSFSKEILPVTALISYQGSGNTWLRHLIQEGTGILTGAIYNDSSLRENGFPGETNVDGHVISVKGHLSLYYALKQLKDLKRAIILIRNPLHTIVSEYNRRYSPGQNHVGVLSLSAFNKSVWPIFSAQIGREWYMLYSSWLRFKGPAILVHYDDLMRKLPQTMRKIFKFLGVNVTKDRFQCMLENQEGNFHRKGINPQTIVFNKKIAKELEEKFTLIDKKLKSRFSF